MALPVADASQLALAATPAGIGSRLGTVLPFLVVVPAMLHPVSNAIGSLLLPF